MRKMIVCAALTVLLPLENSEGAEANSKAVPGKAQQGQVSAGSAYLYEALTNAQARELLLRGPSSSGSDAFTLDRPRNSIVKNDGTYGARVEVESSLVTEITQEGRSASGVKKQIPSYLIERKSFNGKQLAIYTSCSAKVGMVNSWLHFDGLKPKFGDYNSSEIGCRVVDRESCKRLQVALKDKFHDSDLGGREIETMKACEIYGKGIAASFKAFIGGLPVETINKWSKEIQSTEKTVSDLMKDWTGQLERSDRDLIDGKAAKAAVETSSDMGRIYREVELALKTCLDAGFIAGPPQRSGGSASGSAARSAE